MFRWIFRQYFKLTGWKVVGEKPPYSKYLFIVAPHTSQTDFILGKMYCVMNKLSTRFLIKKEAFWFPLGLLLKALGGVPVDRTGRQPLAKQMVDQFKQHDSFILVITPEGTRKMVTKWKKGFHFIAKEAGVPIVLAFIDYKTKTLGIGPAILKMSNYEEDIQTIKSFYRGMEGRHPGQFSVGD